MRGDYCAAQLSCTLRPSADWDWVWVALGWPKRGPRATQASRKGRPWVKLGKCFVCNKSLENGGRGERDRQNCHDCQKSPKLKTQESPRSERQSSPLIRTDDTDRKKIGWIPHRAGSGKAKLTSAVQRNGPCIREFLTSTPECSDIR